MERRDFLMREIEKLILALRKLIGIVEELSSDNFEEIIGKINHDLTELFDLNLNEIIDLDGPEFITKINNLDEENSELFAVLLSEIAKKSNQFDKKTFNSKELAKKAILLLNQIDKKTKAFSFKRMNLKKELQQLIN